MTTVSEQEGWKNKVNRLKEDLEAANFKDTLSVTDFDSFNGALQHLFRRYSRYPVAKFVNERLAPHFEHIKSFEKAISISAQQSANCSYVWSASLAIIECTCRHVSHMQDTFDQLARFYWNFPMFEEYMNLFPKNTRLRFILQDLYEIYSDFCMHTIKYMSRNPLVHIALNLFSSGSRRNLAAILKRWNNAKIEFEENTRLAFRTELIVPRSPKNRTEAAATAAITTATATTSNMPRLQNYFTGRGRFVKKLHDALSKEDWQPGSEPRSCLIHAMGGMGKTQAALKYGYAYGTDYAYRLWVRAENVNMLTESFNSIFSLLGIDQGKMNALDAVKYWMETTEHSWLLIFDNVEEATIDALEALRPTKSTKRSAIILTSQLEQHKHRVQSSLALKSLSDEDSVELLLKCLHRDRSEVTEEDQKLLDEVSKMLGGLPLAIVHIGGYISESRHGLSYFRDFFKSRWQHYAWGGKSVAEQYHKRLEIVWDLALDELPPNARKLIDIMAYLNPDVIPEDWLAEEIARNPNDWDFPRHMNIAELVDMTRSLNKRCLVHLEAAGEYNVFSIHRSLQVALRLDLDRNTERRKAIFNHAISVIRNAAPRASPLQIPDPAQWPQFQRTNPHALALCQAFNNSEPPLDPSVGLADLLYNAGFHVWERWNPITRDGTLLLETAEKILDMLQYDPNSRIRADIACIMSLLFDLMGLSRRSESLRRRQGVYTTRGAILQQSSPEEWSQNEHLYYNATNDLGLSYLQNDEFLKAGELFDSCFEKYKEWGTEISIPYEYAKYYHNMALVRMYQGRYGEAIAMSEKGIPIKKTTDGIDNSRYWWFNYDIASIMLQAGELDRALERHLEVLANRQRICGESQEVTLQSLYTVGAMYYHLNDRAKAEEYLRLCIDRAKKVHWHDGALGRSKYLLAVVLKDKKKDCEESARLYEEASSILADLYERYGTLPSYLENVTDKMVLFDWTQPSFDGRWTGRDLLRVVQEHYQLAD